MLILLLACTHIGTPTVDGDITTTDDSGLTDTADTGDTADTADVGDWSDASLQVVSPSSGDWLDLGEPASFEAHVVDSAGATLDWTDIAWSSSLDAGWAGSGDVFEDASLIAGTHDLIVSTTLPDGTRLGWTVGAVHVQHPDAGTYVGNTMVDVTVNYDGTDYVATCVGATTIVVDVEGQTGTGSSACTVSLNGYDMDLNHDFALELDDGAVAGEADLNLGWSSYAIPVEGEVGGGELQASWTDEVYGYADLAGELDVSRITRETGE